MSPHGERRVLRCSARSIRVHAGFCRRESGSDALIRSQTEAWGSGGCRRDVRASASAASANEAWFWACHGPAACRSATCGDRPSSSALTAPPPYDCAGATRPARRCRSTAPPRPARLRSQASRDRAAGAASATASGSDHARRPRSAASARYTSRSGGATVLDRRSTPPVTTCRSLPARRSRNPHLQLLCRRGCPLRRPRSRRSTSSRSPSCVDDRTPRTVSVGRNSPVNRSSTLIASAIEAGVGLSRAAATSRHRRRRRVMRRRATIGLHRPHAGDATIDLPLDPTRCMSPARPRA